MTSPSSDLQAATDAQTAALIAEATGSGVTGLAAHANALQKILSQLATLTVSQLVALFQNYQHLPEFEQILKAAFPQIVLPHATAAATITAQWYDELQPHSDFRAAPTVQLPAARMDGTLNWALYAPPSRPHALAEPGDTLHMVAPQVTLDRLAGSTKRMVFDASRDTVVSNTFQQGIRWARVAQPDACAFCRLMASKTDSSRLYRTEASATRVVGRSVDLTHGDQQKRAAGLVGNDELLARRYTYSSPREAAKAGKQAGDSKTGQQRGTQALGEKYHDHCRCTAVPVPDGQSYQAPEYTEQWRQDYQDAVKATKKKAGKTKGQYGAIDVNAVLAHMRANTDAH